MSFWNTRPALAALTLVFAMGISRLAAACDMDSECSDGQVCIGYVCRKAPTPPPPPAPPPAATYSAPPPSSASAPTAAAPAAAGDVKPMVHEGSFGIDAAFPLGGTPTVGFAYFLSRDIAFRMNVGLEWDFKPASAFQFSAEPSLRFYFGNTRVRPFFEPAVYVAYSSATLDVALTGALGAEFFIWNTFSIGASAGLGLSFSALNEDDRTIKLTTGSSNLFLAYYW